MIKEKSRETLKKKYGSENLREIQGINEKRKKTCIEKYGGETPFHNTQIQEKATETLCAKYGGRSSTTKLSEAAIKAFQSKENMEEFLLSIPDDKRTLYEIEQRLNYSGTLFARYYKKYNLNYIHYQSNHSSKYEEEILALLTSYGVKCIKSEREILEGKEIDLYLPDFQIGIEFNGSYWHDDNHKERNYHQEKSLKAKEKGIFLYHIWESEWKNPLKKDIIISQLKNFLNMSTKIYARKTEVKRITAKDCHKFLDENHLQGFRAATNYYGLYFQGELVSCMSFGKNYIGQTETVELLRFCNKKGLTVVGGASKLFKCFLKEHPETKEVISYCNLAKGKGKLYLNLGMKLDKITEPNYFWVNPSSNDVLNRYSTQMKKENTIMREKGYLKNYDCGNMKFVWNYIPNQGRSEDILNRVKHLNIEEK